MELYHTCCSYIEAHLSRTVYSCSHLDIFKGREGGDRRCLTEARVPSFNDEKIDQNPPLRHFAYILRHNITFFHVEIKNTCLSEALFVIRLKVVTDEAALRHEFRVLTGRISIKYPPLRHFHAFYVII